MLYSVMRE